MWVVVSLERGPLFVPRGNSAMLDAHDAMSRRTCRRLPGRSAV